MNSVRQNTDININSNSNVINNKLLLCLSILVVILLIDQFSKIWVKTHMSLYESIDVFSWFKILFVENPGMAFGWEFGKQQIGEYHYGKLFLSLFRIVAIFFIGFFLFRLTSRNLSTGFLISVTLILAGALGNMVDGVFYGEIFSSSNPNQIANYVGFGNGYGSWMQGRVVDMFYFPLFSGTFPDWFPSVGGEDYIFFSPVFNVADSAITIGIILILLFYRKDLSKAF